MNQMLVSDLLRKIRGSWLARISNQLGRGEEGRGLLLEELKRFFDMLIQAVESGDPGWLKPILIDWAYSRTETDMSDEEITLSPVLSTIVIETTLVARDELQDDQVLDLLEVLTPIFNYSYEQIAQHEALVRIGYVSARLEKIQMELERLDRSKSDFIAVAAHELKTPLTLIEGYASMLREQVLNENENETPLVLLKGVDNGIRRLGEIIDDMIDVSMIDNDMLSLNFQPMWLNRLLNVLKQEMADHVKERNQILEINDFPGSNEMIFADTERIHKALTNILTNAIKYTPDGGKITVEGRLLSGFVEILVKDTGIGIAEEDQTRIFEKFGGLGDVSLHSSGKTKFKGGGPGLGLPITKGILEAHGGSIWVESDGCDEENLPGSTFHILIPLRKEPPDDQVAKLFEATSDAGQESKK
jgi:signal transduction histidine kinase